MGNEQSSKRSQNVTTPPVVRNEDTNKLLRAWAKSHADCLNVTTDRQRERCENSTFEYYTLAFDDLAGAVNEFVDAVNEANNNK